MQWLTVSTIAGIDSDRIRAITILTTSAPILIVGVYLTTADHPIEDFLQCLHTIQELVNKHHGPIILAGDFNFHVGKSGGPRAQGNRNHHGKLLLELVHNYDVYLTSLSNNSAGPVYTYFRDDIQTTTDYIIVDATLSLSPIYYSRSPTQPRLNWSADEDDGSTWTYAAAVSDIIQSYCLVTDLHMYAYLVSKCESHYQ